MREQISPAWQPGLSGAWLNGVKGSACGPVDQNPCLIEDQVQGGTWSGPHSSSRVYGLLPVEWGPLASGSKD
jgi:hypothetical protein